MNNGYVDFNERYNEKSNEGFYEEIEESAEGAANLLRTLRFEKTGEAGAITITGIELSDYCYYIGDSAVDIPEKIMNAPVTAIADYASDNTSTDYEIRSVTLPKTLKSVGKGAFADMGDFNSVEIPASVTEIGEYAFGYIRDVSGDGKERYEKLDDFVIECYPGTAGEKYAKDNGFEYKLLTDN